MAADDQVILVTHQPRWLSDWFWDETACHNLRQLVRGHLKGRARLHLAGTVAGCCCHVQCFRMFSCRIPCSSLLAALKSCSGKVYL